MPCGGIYPAEYDQPWNHRCFLCKWSGGGPWSFVEEWDADIHDECIDKFLETMEGKIVINHGHEVVRR